MSRPRRALPTVDPAARWTVRPGQAEVWERFYAFTDALAQGELEVAFRLCPVVDRGQLLTPMTDPDWFARHLPDVLFSYADPYDTEDPRDLAPAVRDRWLRSLRQPRIEPSEQRELVVPPREGRDLLVDLAVDGVYGHLAARFTLERVEGGWALCFSDIDMP